MKLSQSLFTLIACIGLLLGGCSPKDPSTTGAPGKREVSVEVVAAQAKGFTVGAMMSTATAYVFFDSQCPHCGHLWEASLPLHKKVKFVWIPVGWINASSKSQGAALLTSANPQALMTEHEASLLAGKGGMAASSNIPSDILDAIEANTKLLGSFGAESVPFVVVKNLRSGQTVTRDGALATSVLADLIGLDATP